jgi:hypothetical protein
MCPFRETALYDLDEKTVFQNIKCTYIAVEYFWS